MTEASSLLTVLPHEDAADHADSVGYAVPSVDLAILPLGDDRAAGELVARGPNVMTGYWNRPGETRAAFTDGWSRRCCSPSRASPTPRSSPSRTR